MLFHRALRQPAWLSEVEDGKLAETGVLVLRAPAAPLPAGNCAVVLNVLRGITVSFLLCAPTKVLIPFLVLEFKSMSLVGAPMLYRQLVVVLLEQLDGCFPKLLPCRRHAALGVRDGMVPLTVMVSARPGVASQIDAESSLVDGALTIFARGPFEDENSSGTRHLWHMEHDLLLADLRIDLVAIYTLWTVLLIFARSSVADALERPDATGAVGLVLPKARLTEGSWCAADAGVPLAHDCAICIGPQVAESSFLSVKKVNPFPTDTVRTGTQKSNERVKQPCVRGGGSRGTHHVEAARSLLAPAVHHGPMVHCFKPGLPANTVVHLAEAPGSAPDLLL